MPIFPIHSPHDPRIAPYRNLKERDLAAEGGRFIAEGQMLVRRLLASRYACESVLVAEKRLADIREAVPDSVALYVAPSAIVNETLGFKFHSGVMAVGLRGAAVTIDGIFSARTTPSPPPSPTRGDAQEAVDSTRRVRERECSLTLVICPEIEKTDNLGALIRVAAALGADGLILGERCCDPFFRQSVRVSMGAVFSLPIVRSPDLAADLKRLREAFAVELVATVLSADAQELRTAPRGERIGLLLGNEAQGLGPEWVDLCDRRVTIPMKLGTDSLNVAAAAAVFLYHFTRSAC